MKTSILRPARRTGFVSLLALAVLSAGASTAMAGTAAAPAPAQHPTPVLDTSSIQSTAVKIQSVAAGPESDRSSQILSIEVIPKPEPEPEPLPEPEVADDAPDALSGTGGVTEDRSVNSDDASTGNIGENILDTARSGIGVPYVWAGSTQAGWDCSGFTSWVYAQHGISLPHSSGAQAAMGTVVPESEAQVGDLVHWPGHVGIYAGNGKVVDAGTSPQSTTERNIWGSPTFTHISPGA